MLRLTRVNSLIAKFRPYKVFINGIHRGNIKVNETKEFEVNNGNHIVHVEFDWGKARKYAKGDWDKSKKIEVEVDNSVAELEVVNWLSDAKGINYLFLFLRTLLVMTGIYWTSTNDFLCIRKKLPAPNKHFR